MTLTSTDLTCSSSGLADNAVDSGDCDDDDSAINPGATELAGDGVDSDCDGTELCYVDADDDGHRTDATTSSGDLTCTGSGLAAEAEPSGDCDDNDATVNAGATELAGDGVDQNCDGVELCYVDADVDGYRTTDTRTSSDVTCTSDGLAPESATSGDCDDNDPDSFPGATEVVGDGVDQSCDGQEICYVDADNDGYRTDNEVTTTNVDCAGSGEATPGGWYRQS